MEIKHCPFCGGESEFRIVQGEEHKALTVVCKKQLFIKYTHYFPPSLKLTFGASITKPFARS